MAVWNETRLTRSDTSGRQEKAESTACWRRETHCGSVSHQAALLFSMRMYGRTLSFSFVFILD